MSERKTEPPFQMVWRHLRNGYVILNKRGIGALYGAAMGEAAKLVDSSVGFYLAPKDIFRDGPALMRSLGLRATIGAVFRRLAADYDPPVGLSNNPVNQAGRAAAVRYYHTYDLTKPDGVVPARRPVNDVDFALEVPFSFKPRQQSADPVAAIVHVFYPEELASALTRLLHIPCPVDLFLSTDTQDKKAAIAAQTMDWAKGSVEIRVLPNRGRDIGAKFVGFRDVYDHYDLFIHLHIKKSPHGGAPLARWRNYLFDNLIGSPAIAQSILSLFDDPKLGIVFPQHLFELRGILNWGYDYDLARALLRRLGVEIDKNMVLEFPSGSMFWGRSAAIKPLLDVGLGYDDFPDETGQVDGTLAHAIERVILMVAESRGFEWLKVIRRDLYPLTGTILPVTAPADIARHRLKVFQPCLVCVDAERHPYAHLLRETQRIAPYPSHNPRPRLNLIVPTVNPRQTFGGIATALRLFSAWADLMPNCDRRIIATDAEIEPEGYAALADYTPTPFSASSDLQKWALVDAMEREGGRLDMRDREIFVGTAWWTVDIIRGLEQDRQRFFGGNRQFVYIIQDDEPYFDGWSARFALAETTYQHSEQTIAVINSEELFAVMTAKYKFSAAFCLPYTMNARIFERLEPQPRERTILIYGRPAVARNAYAIICEALKIWQQRDPIRASRWRIVFLGEAFDAALAKPVQNASIEGKVSLEAYADHLNRAAVGVSLMISPHPSYPPLEMAAAGVLTIANSYPGKDLRNRFPDIVLVDDLRPTALADEIEQAVAKTEPGIGAIHRPPRGLAPALPGPVADPEAIACVLRNSLAS